MRSRRLDAVDLIEADFTLVKSSVWRKRWWYNFTNRTLVLQQIWHSRYGLPPSFEEHESGRYEVDLDRINSRSELIGTLGHVTNKSWAKKDALIVAGLVDAFDDLFHLEGLPEKFDPAQRMAAHGYPVVNEPPVIRCVRSPEGRQLGFKCGYCGLMHYHGSGGPKSEVGAGDGHRVAHCNWPIYRELGYTLKEIVTPRPAVLKILGIKF